MSDYMFMLENHLNPEQNRVVAEVRHAAAIHKMAVYLTGGAMRDMLGGFPIRDLDFAVEGDAVKLVKTLVKETGAKSLSQDSVRRTEELRFPGGVTAEIGMARSERYARPGGKPHVSPATIREDLLNRDFTVNAIALSLNEPSLGLLIDPTNGLADLEHRELRAVHSYVFFDDPLRILRLERFRVRLGFTVEEKTLQQLANAREAEVEKLIPSRKLYEEMRHIANDPNPAGVVRALDEARLLTLFSPALEGPKINIASLARLEKAVQTIPFGVDLGLDCTGLFIYFLNEKLSSKERTALIRGTGMTAAEAREWQQIDTRAKKLQKALDSRKLQKPSEVYRLLAGARPEETIFLLVRSESRLAHDRIKNYLQKYLPAAREVTDQEVLATGVKPDTPAFAKARNALIAEKLDTRKRKEPPAPEPTPTPAPEPAPRGRFRRARAPAY